MVFLLDGEGLFFLHPDDRDPYTIVIPPPNVTGVLHMGHMLNNTPQDIIIRRARMQGYNACWVPGTDTHLLLQRQRWWLDLKNKASKNRHCLVRLF